MIEYQPFFQLETRLKGILDFSRVGRTHLAPFSKAAEKVTIIKADKPDEMLTFEFVDSKYEIHASWDRLIFKYEANLGSLTESGNPIEGLYLPILNTLKKLDSFGQVLNHVLYLPTVAIIPDINRSDLLEKFNSKFDFQFSGLQEDLDDLALILEYKNLSRQIKLEIGPYFGTADLEKRSIVPKWKSQDLADGNGFMFLLTILDASSSFDYQIFKKNFDLLMLKKNELWNRMQ
jgi:hypothetical protein